MLARRNMFCLLVFLVVAMFIQRNQTDMTEKAVKTQFKLDSEKYFIWGLHRIMKTCQFKYTANFTTKK